MLFCSDVVLNLCGEVRWIGGRLLLGKPRSNSESRRWKPHGKSCKVHEGPVSAVNCKGGDHRRQGRQRGHPRREDDAGDRQIMAQMSKCISCPYPCPCLCPCPCPNLQHPYAYRCPASASSIAPSGLVIWNRCDRLPEDLDPGRCRFASSSAADLLHR